jgi:hypothetical protein
VVLGGDTVGSSRPRTDRESVCLVSTEIQAALHSAQKVQTLLNRPFGVGAVVILNSVYYKDSVITVERESLRNTNRNSEDNVVG